MDRRTGAGGRSDGPWEKDASERAKYEASSATARDGGGDGGGETFYSSYDYNSQLRRFRVRFSNRDIQFHIRPLWRSIGCQGKENRKRKRAINKTREATRGKEGVERGTTPPRVTE